MDDRERCRYRYEDLLREMNEAVAMCNPQGISKECGKGRKPILWLSMLRHFHGLPLGRDQNVKLSKNAVLRDWVLACFRASMIFCLCKTWTR
jgi:hypothetical protein